MIGQCCSSITCELYESIRGGNAYSGIVEGGVFCHGINCVSTKL